MEKKTVDLYQKNIPAILDTLEQNFYDKKSLTTLNRMRENPDPFKLLISCLLSLRARDEVTERISEELFKIADTPKKIIELDQKLLEKTIFSSGHYKKKALVLKSVSREIIERFHNTVPDTKEELLSIKGIGPKTSNIVLSFVYKKQYLPIDSNCHRVSNRLSWVATKTPLETEQTLEKILPKKYWEEFNGIFMQFGRKICVPVSPFCSTCPVSHLCPKINVTKSR